MKSSDQTSSIVLLSFEFSDQKLGVHNKIQGQAKAFEELGYTCTYIYIYNNELISLRLKDNNKRIIGTIKKGRLLTSPEKIMKRTGTGMNKNIDFQSHL